MLAARLRAAPGLRAGQEPVPRVSGTAARALRPRSSEAHVEPRGSEESRALDVALRGGVAEGRTRVARRRPDAAAAHAALWRRDRPCESLRQGRRPEPDRLVQSARAIRRAQHGEGARRRDDCAADRRQRRRCRSGLCRAGRAQVRRRDAGRHAGREHHRGARIRRRRAARERTDLRCRQADRVQGRGGRLVRSRDAEGAVPHRRQEDDGLRALGRIRRRHCPT